MKRLLFSLVAVCAASQAAVIQLSAPSIVTGSTFDVAVGVSNVFANFPDDAVIGFGFNVTGSPTATFTGATVNSAFFDDLSGCCAGTDVVGLTNIGFPQGLEAGDFGEPLLLATLHFSVVGPGPATVGVTADNIADLNQGLYFASGAENFSASQPVSISSAAAVPEPGMMLVSGLGLVALCLLRRTPTRFFGRN